MSKRIALAVTNDLTTDQRLHKMCTTLQQLGYEPILVGISRGAKPENLKRKYTTYRLPMRLQGGPGFYLAYNYKLLRWLLQEPLDAVTANDPDTLPACFVAARLKRIPLVYDSHEFFTGVPELTKKPFQRWVWSSLEKMLIPRIKHLLTVNQAVAEAYYKRLGVKMTVVYNWPFQQPITAPPVQPPVVLYQGAIQKGRGLEVLLEAFATIKGAQLWIVGGGYALESLKELASQLQLNERVRFWRQVTFEQLAAITSQASICVSLEPPDSQNNALSSPNKVFDAIQAHRPLIVTARPGLESLFKTYKVGVLLFELTPIAVSKAIKHLLVDKEAYAKHQQACAEAAREYCWEEQVPILRDFYSVATAQYKKGPSNC